MPWRQAWPGTPGSHALASLDWRELLLVLGRELGMVPGERNTIIVEDQSSHFIKFVFSHHLFDAVRLEQVILLVIRRWDAHDLEIFVRCRHLFHG